MSYDANIQLIEQPALAELYQFESNNVFQYYTSYKDDITFQGNVYKAMPISRTSLSFDADFRDINLTITAPVTDPFITYITNSPLEVINIIIYQAFTIELTDFRVIYEGQIKQVGIKDKIAKALCESNSLALREMLPRFIYQSYCNYNVYDNDCGITKAASNFEVITTVTVTGSTLISSDFIPKGDGFFTGGHVISSDGDIRLITNHVGDTLTIQIPFDTRVSTGDTIKAYAGCDKSIETCTNKFNNQQKFMGCPYIPSKNPSVWGL